MQHVVFNHIEVNLLQPLTKKLIINAFSQEVVNVMLSVPMREAAFMQLFYMLNEYTRQKGRL